MEMLGLSIQSVPVQCLGVVDCPGTQEHKVLDQQSHGIKRHSLDGSLKQGIRSKNQAIRHMQAKPPSCERVQRWMVVEGNPEEAYLLSSLEIIIVSA